jgi:hypothetical protein
LIRVKEKDMGNQEAYFSSQEERLGGAVSNSGHRQFLLNYRKALGVVVAAASLPQESVSEAAKPGRQAGKSNWGHPPHTEAQRDRDVAPLIPLFCVIVGASSQIVTELTGLPLYKSLRLSLRDEEGQKRSVFGR